MEGLKTKALTYETKPVSWEPYPLDNPPRLPQLTQDYLWAVIIPFPTHETPLTWLQRLGRYWRDGDFVIAETGTSSYGIPGSSLRGVKSVKMYNQTIFGSIGFASGAAVGSFVAGKEMGTIKRPILVTGEGSLQLTVQAFSDMLRHEVNPTV